MSFIECTSFILVKDNKILLEKRKMSKEIDPGLVVVPGGHCEENESMEDTLFRESFEELGIVPIKYQYLCSLLHRTVELEKIHYFVITDWNGEIQNNEAESVFWINFNEVDKIEIDADRVAVNELFRVYTGHLA